MDEELFFHPVTGKLDIRRDIAGSSDGGNDDEDDDGVELACCISMPDDRSALVCNPNPAHPTCAELPSFSVETIHISCKSDAYQGSKNCYAGVIIYSCDGKSQWQTANGTRCKSGYLVIMDTATEKVTKYQQKSPGQVHGAVYRSAFGEECKARNVNAEGFSVMKGVFKVNSGVFNPAEDGYHDDKRSMHPLSARCIQKVVDSWMNSGEHFYSCRNFAVEDLLRDTQRVVSPFVQRITSAIQTTTAVAASANARGGFQEFCRNLAAKDLPREPQQPVFPCFVARFLVAPIASDSQIIANRAGRTIGTVAEVTANVLRESQCLQQ